jgi:integrase
LWRFLALTGCRRGEALGLRWPGVDLRAATATLTNQRTIAGGSIVEGAPKTASGARTVALDPRTVDALRRWRAVQNSERMLLGSPWPKDEFVFTHPDGAALWPQR